ncbi:MAG: DUF2497 domain-containing protein [Acidocella sp.]|nr:DUF2497 domain-containing protein [Acidocella sp.]
MSDHNEVSNNSGPASSAEPSMEEILASIRRILKEDEAATDPDTPEDEGILRLDASMIATPAYNQTAPDHFEPEPEPEYDPEPVYQPAAYTTSGGHDAIDTRPEPVHESFSSGPEPVIFHPQEPQSMQEIVPPPNGLVSEDAAGDVARTIGSLINSISQDRNVSVSRGGITIEDIVREEIRPVLKAWFDTHLPSLVERIVRSEIARVVERTQI